MDKEKKAQLAALGLKARVFDKLIQLMEQARRWKCHDTNNLIIPSIPVRAQLLKTRWCLQSLTAL